MSISEYIDPFTGKPVKERKSIFPFMVCGLADHFQVSQRTIRNDLKEINALLLEQAMPKLAIGKGGQIKPPARFEEILPALSPEGLL